MSCPKIAKFQSMDFALKFQNKTDQMYWCDLSPLGVSPLNIPFPNGHIFIRIFPRAREMFSEQFLRYFTFKLWT